MRILLQDIYVGQRARKDLGGKELEDLKQDMQENGQITAITVRPPGAYDKIQPDYQDEKWALVAGGRRVVAAALLEWPDIEGYEREEMGELTHRILELHENLKRKAMDWTEEVASKAEILRLRRIENPELEEGALAASLGFDPGNFNRDVKTAEMVKKNPSLKNAGSKTAAHRAGKLLQEDELRTKAQLVTQGSKTVEEMAGPLAERVVSLDAMAYVSSHDTAKFDLALLDGPYGYNYWSQGQKNQGSASKRLSEYDDSPEAVGNLYTNLMPELARVVRPSGWLVMFCGMETFILLQELARDVCAEHFQYRHYEGPVPMNACSSKFPHKFSEKDRVQGDCRFLLPEPYPWIWYRPNSRNQPRHPHLHAQNVAELIFVCNMGRGRLVKKPCPSLIIAEAEYGASRIHVNQKPLDLYKELVERFTFVGDSVLDCFFGSGNSLAAAASLGRVPYGSDSNPNMLPFALARIRANLSLITKDQIAESHDRYKRALELQPLTEQDLAEDQREPEWVQAPGQAPFTYVTAAP